MPLSHLTNLLGPATSDLVLWKDVKKSAAIVSLVSFFWLVVVPFSFTPAQLVSLAIAAITPLSLGWSLAAGFLKREGPTVPDFLTNGISSEEISKHASTITGAINPTLGMQKISSLSLSCPHSFTLTIMILQRSSARY